MILFYFVGDLRIELSTARVQVVHATVTLDSVCGRNWIRTNDSLQNSDLANRLG